MNIEDIEQSAIEEINKVENVPALNELKGKLLGKKSKLSSVFSMMKDLPIEEKKKFGEKVNQVKVKITEYLQEKQKELENAKFEKQIKDEDIDITLPARNHQSGSRHPWQAIVDDFTEYFLNLGYQIAEGPEVESDHYNFELLNIPKDHPARDAQDSFFIDENTLMRSHTSPVQAHIMQQSGGKGPIKIICPGKVFRRDEDLTHSHQFGQIEALVIDENVNMGTLQETLTQMIHHFFGEKRKVRFRPSFFPFTEPSVEVDVSCFECDGKGCKLCKHTGWIEVLGAGMVHPNVLRLNGFDDKKYQGFAFGIGIDRFAMLKYGVDDIHRFYQNDIDFIKQFRKE